MLRIPMIEKGLKGNSLFCWVELNDIDFFLLTYRRSNDWQQPMFGAELSKHIEGTLERLLENRTGPFPHRNARCSGVLFAALGSDHPGYHLLLLAPFSSLLATGPCFGSLLGLLQPRFRTASFFARRRRFLRAKRRLPRLLREEFHPHLEFPLSKSASARAMSFSRFSLSMFRASS